MSKDGSGRVAIYKATGIVRCYTLECNYNIGRMVNLVPAAHNLNDPEVNLETCPTYCPETYEDLGKGICLALLDSIDLNPYSRLKNSPYSDLMGAKVAVAEFLAGQLPFR